MQKLKKQNGITLIALIITIIVMLILVGVTVNVALNGGLFATAKQAAYQTEISTIQEQLEIAKASKIADNKGIIPTDYGITIESLDIPNELKNKYSSKLIISKDGVLYYDSSVVVEEQEQNWLDKMEVKPYEGEQKDEDLALLEKYFLGVDGTGRDFVNDIFDSDNNGFKQYDQIEEHPEEKIEFFGNAAYDFYIKYNEKVYAVRTIANAEETEFMTKSVEYKYTQTGREGQKYAYDIDGDGKEEECTVLYDYGEGKGIEIVAPTVIGSGLTLGYNDSTINWNDQIVIEKADIDKNGTLENIEKTIYSYNNAIKTINDYAKDQVKNENIPKENIRSVGSNPTNPYSENIDVYTSDNLAKWNAKYNGVVKKGDMNYEEDLIRMIYHEVATIRDTYCLTSRFVSEDLDGVGFGMIVCAEYSTFTIFGLFDVTSSGSIEGGETHLDVRPVIKLNNI